MELRADSMCFACGGDNPMGLRLTFREEGGCYITCFTPQEHHQSYVGVTHGGIITTILDEVMGRYLAVKGIPAMTARMEVRFRQTFPVGETIKFTGWVTRQKGKVIDMEARAERADGTVAATATGRFLRVSQKEIAWEGGKKGERQ